MANWCSNFVTFDGDTKQVEKIMNVFQKMEKLSRDKGQKFLLLDPSVSVNNWFFDININDEQSICYETKWSPDPVHLIKACKLFSVNFMLNSEELNNDYIGCHEYTYETDELKWKSLTPDEIESTVECQCSIPQPHASDDDTCEERYSNIELMENILDKKPWYHATYDLESNHVDELEDIEQ